eukprot:TRINITY_DN3502_c0_g1_i1.p1 TRINITY_DN3502_c0_g1~~TRINITY_DN3502_c0_g1_i1.p1  ORF type:complete len:836 (+),score=230.49 TRINITY_DN3502_c0_g1_i1:131-2638(+)
MGVLRSEQMKHGTLVLPVDRARHFIDLIGSKTNMQFEDMNAREMHRPYKKHIQRIDEMERILRFLFEEFARTPGNEVVRNNLDSFLDNADDYKLDEVEARLKKMYQDFMTLKENNAKIATKRNEALEERYVAQTAIAWMSQIGGGVRSGSSRGRASEADFSLEASRPLMGDQDNTGGRQPLHMAFSNIAGVIPQADQDRFARALFRAAFGNTYTLFQEIPEPMLDPKTGKEVQKSVFVVYFQDSRDNSRGMTMSAMAEKVNRVCASYGVHTYDWPNSVEEAEQMKASLLQNVEEQDRSMRALELYVHAEAESVLEVARFGGNSIIEEWRMFCAKEKGLYATLNLFEGNMNLRASCWYPAAEEDQIRAMLIRSSSQQQGHSSAMLVSDRTLPRRTPPTFIRKNEFMGIFQELVDTYGLPRYGEANPALFMMVTFPFLFGVMYGDVGHGGGLFLVGLFLLWKGETFKYSVPIAYEARYIITMMGFFGMYCGFLYNDFFSVGFEFFGSRWEHGAHTSEGTTFEPLYDTKNMGGPGPYPFGLDPAWHGAANELIYMNSLKMKLSVVLGVAQMIVGLLLRFSNALYEGSTVDFLFECCPMMVFMLCFFGFMDWMILYKWVYPIPNPPSIINSMIAMAMWQDDPGAMFGMPIVRFLMILTMLAVPCMLLPKPIIAVMSQKTQQNGGNGGGNNSHFPLGDEEGQCLESCEAEAGDHHDIGEMVIHQIIETIEYVLGTVSHTASYLRLWALSLAHQQLSVVFFEKTILSGMQMSFPVNVFGLFFCFAIWFVITVGILMIMDVMECFLHTLRLHWVEFQSKFYKADGYQFSPYRHKDILEAVRE